MLSSLLIVVPFLAGINAVNDWNVPCLDGACSWDIPTGAGASSSGTMTIWGSEDAISDITGAADWEILDCDPNALAQDIRLVCTTDSADAKCSHLYQNIGAEGKIVRLPENCGSNAFARVAKAWTSEDQSIPASVSRRLVRRDGAQPEVKALRLDTKFDLVDVKKAGSVNIAIQAANIPGVNGAIQLPPSRRNTRLSQRALGDFVSDAIGSIGDKIKDAADKVKDAGAAVVDKVVDVAQGLNDFDLSQSFDLPPLSFDQTVTLFDQQLSCEPVDASLKVDLDGKADATAAIGVAAVGTIIPPKFDDFGVVVDMTASVDGTFDITANIAGTIDSGEIEFLNIGIPGLDFPGILTVGPSFQIAGQLEAELELNLEMQVGVNFNIENARLEFPPKKNADGEQGIFEIGDTPLTLSASPSIEAIGTVTAHFIPSINLGISALGDLVKAEIFLNLDASASLKLELEGSKTFASEINNGAAGEDEAAEEKDDSAKDKETETETETATAAKNTEYKTKEQKDKEMAHETKSKAHATQKASNKKMGHQTQQTKTTKSADSNKHESKKSEHTKVVRQAAGDVAADDGTFGGCFSVNAGLSVNAGAEGSFFGLFDDSTEVELFNKEFELFKKCFGDSATVRRSLRSLSSLERRRLQARALECPAGGVTDAVSVVDNLVVQDAKAV
ncbi:hypothetical protein C8J57DRAFT_1296618 [Mycena rebaudengoi]|nr:hypothetical protein C8J57DRAFT_1296618 [Mycena rebaudengoi]